jgi:hypothetical protein
MARDEDNTKILDLLKQKEFVLKIQKEAYVRWVDLITLIRFSMIGGAACRRGLINHDYAAIGILKHPKRHYRYLLFFFGSYIGRVAYCIRNG